MLNFEFDIIVIYANFSPGELVFVKNKTLGGHAGGGGGNAAAAAKHAHLKRTAGYQLGGGHYWTSHQHPERVS